MLIDRKFTFIYSSEFTDRLLQTISEAISSFINLALLCYSISTDETIKEIQMNSNSNKRINLINTYVDYHYDNNLF